MSSVRRVHGEGNQSMCMSRHSMGSVVQPYVDGRYPAIPTRLSTGVRRGGGEMRQGVHARPLKEVRDASGALRAQDEDVRRRLDQERKGCRARLSKNSAGMVEEPSTGARRR